MNAHARLLYILLMRGSRALAGYAAGDLLEKNLSLAEAVVGDPFATWQAWFMARLEELAAAAAFDRPELFTRQTRWSASVLAARGVAPEAVRAALDSLRDVLSKELPEGQQAMAAALVERGRAALDEEPWASDQSLLPDTPDGRLASAYVLAVLEGDRRRAAGLVLDAARQGRPIGEIYCNVLLPAQAELGRMWAADEINIAEEHFTSATTRWLMAQLAASAACGPANGRTAVAATVAGNQHDLGLQMVSDLLELDGWRVVHLGADVPAADLVQAIDCFGADLVALSAARTTQLETLRETIAAIRRGPNGQRVRILVGGAAFRDADDLYASLGADAFAADAQQAVDAANRLVAHAA